MAQSILSDIAVGLISKLGSSVLNEIGLWWGLKDELEDLKATLSTIHAVLCDAEDKSMDEPVKIWLAMLSEAMYDADDLIDDFSTEALRQQVMGGCKTAKEVRVFFSSSNQFAFGLQMAHKIKAMRHRLKKIAANRKFHLETRSSVEIVSVAKGRNQTHSSPPQVVIGREAEKESIVKLLLSSDYEENVSIVPIVGIGGLGKTTLAQLVYNDDKVQKHFELKMWVYVSDYFDVQLVVKKVIESATRKTPKTIEMDPLKNLLHEKINGRKYLLVLDDLWNEDASKWFSFKDLLAGGAKGSKVIITTRLRMVAEMSRPICIYELGGLNEDESWSLFSKMAFKQGQVVNPSHEAIGREVVAKCCGVPLAIRVIGAMMYSIDLESEWLSFKNKELSKIDIYREDILPILNLSYSHLPSHYKHCFAYCSLYPKGYDICVEELIYLWKAQGYLNRTDSNMCLQDVGFRCVMDLFRLSFFQEVTKDGFGNFSICKMHDLMHDLAVSVAENNFSASLSKLTTVKENTRHILFQVDGDFTSHEFSSLLKAKKIRTLLGCVDYQKFLFDYQKFDIKEEELDGMFCNLRCLRVLSLSCFYFDKLPSSIYKLKHLRHLDLSYNNHIKQLPDSMTNLQNLQVLILIACSSLNQLPDNITKLVNLTDLDNYRCDELTRIPRGIGRLTRLEKLSLFVIAKDNSISSKYSSGLDELHALNNLRGSLEIKNLKYLKDPTFEFKSADLIEKKQLQDLALCWNGDPNDMCSASDVANDEMGVEALHPHQNLKGLTIRSYRGVRPPSWLPSIINLVSIKLQDCRSITCLPPCDQLPYLETLWIFGLTRLEHIDVGVNFENGGVSSFFPSLTDLTLEDCPNLKGFLRCKTDDVGMEPSPKSVEELPSFPCLSRLRIGRCLNLTYMPLFTELFSLILVGDGVKSFMKVVKMETTYASESTSSLFSTFSKLESISIEQMEDCAVDELLHYLPSLQLPSIQHLWFNSCPCKSVSGDEKDDGKQWQNLKVLRQVDFGSMQNLVSLPKGLQYVTTLEHLGIYECPGLVSMPEWIRNLITLQGLTINDCPKLSERCKNNTAEDWPKISHIPNIYVDNESIQRNGCYLL